MEDRWKKIVATKARDVVDLDNLTDESLELLTDDIGPEAYIMELAAAGQWMDANRTLASSLPRREAAWWGCMCAREMQIVQSEKDEQLALSAAEKWVHDPTSERRAIAFQMAQESKSNSTGTLCALAVAFSEPALPLADDQELEVDSNQFPTMILGVILMAATEDGDDQMNVQLEKFLKVGEKIAMGGSGKSES